MVRSQAGGTTTDSKCNFRFHGQYEDEETGLCYNRFRYYMPSEGMYTQRDPIGLAGGNPTVYGYTWNSLLEIDPWGLNISRWVNPQTLNFSQAYVGIQVLDYENLMRTNRWDWIRSPLDVAEIDGIMVSLDNRRLLAAQRAGVESVPINIVDLNSVRPDGGTYGSNLSKKLNSRPKKRPDLPRVQLPSTGTPNRPEIVSNIPPNICQ